MSTTVVAIVDVGCLARLAVKLCVLRKGGVGALSGPNLSYRTHAFMHAFCFHCCFCCCRLQDVEGKQAERASELGRVASLRDTAEGRVVKLEADLQQALAEVQYTVCMHSGLKHLVLFLEPFCVFVFRG